MLYVVVVVVVVDREILFDAEEMLIYFDSSTD